MGLNLVHAANSRVAISNRQGIPADIGDLLLRSASNASNLDQVAHACARGGSCYGDSATVGAGFQARIVEVEHEGAVDLQVIHVQVAQVSE